MTLKEVIVCDGCGRILGRTSEIYKLNLETDKFWDGVEMDYNLINLDFCPICAMNIKKTLEKIATKLSNKNQKEV